MSMVKKYWRCSYMFKQCCRYSSFIKGIKILKTVDKFKHQMAYFMLQNVPIFCEFYNSLLSSDKTVLRILGTGSGLLCAWGWGLAQWSVQRAGGFESQYPSKNCTWRILKNYFLFTAHGGLGFVLHYLNRITVWYAAPQTALWGGLPTRTRPSHLLKKIGVVVV